MANTLGDTYINTLMLNAGDAMSNMFDVVVTLPGGLNGMVANASNLLKFRAKGFTAPTFNIKTYDRKYKTLTLKMPSTAIEGERTFDIEFRIDSNWDVYTALKAWKAYFMAESSGYATNEIQSSHTGTITVSAIDTPIVSDTGFYTGETDGEIATTSTNIVWTFQDVWITKLTEPAMTMDDATALTTTASFTFGRYKDPYAKMFFKDTVGG